MSTLEQLIVGYLCLGVFGVWVLVRHKGAVYYLPVVVCAGLTVALNLVGLVYFYATRDSTVFDGLAVSDVVKGVGINLVYAAMWIGGYLVATRAGFGRDKRGGAPREGETPAMLILLALCLAAVAYGVIGGMGYAYGQKLYLEAEDDAASMGPVLVFRAIAAPAAAALLYQLRDARRVDLIGTSVSAKRLRLVLWVALAAAAGVNGVQTLQRGFIFQGVLLATFVLFGAGRQRLALGAAAAAVLIGLVASPIIVAWRGQDPSDDVSMSYIADETYEGGVGMDAIVQQAAISNKLAITGGAMVQYTREHGHAGFATYKTLPTNQIPRFLYPDKPYPLSADGTAFASPPFIVGVILDRPKSSGWDSGGATMYWQFGWMGVVFGGLLVGIGWAALAAWGLKRRSIIATALVFSMMRWGSMLFESADYLANRMMALMRVFAVVWIVGYVLRSIVANSSGKRAVRPGRSAV